MKNIQTTLWSSRAGLIFCFVQLVFPSLAVAQMRPSTSQSQGTQATPLPLSGRNGQNGSVNTTESPLAGTTTSVNTINPTVQAQGAYSGSVSSTTKMPFSGKLSLREAIQRGLAFNLGAIGIAQVTRQAHGQSRIARSALLPNISGDLSETVQQENLKALGVRFSAPGFNIPTVVGPFNYMDLRARLSQTLLDRTALNNYRSAMDVERASRLSIDDARDLIVLGVGGSYLQTIAAQGRVNSARAQLETANTLYQQVQQQRGAGLVAQVDVDRGQVEALTQQQRLTSLENDFAKRKIDLARMAGLPPTDQYELTDDIVFAPAPPVTLEAALKQAFEFRSDLKAAQAQVQAADHSVAAARAERLPSLSVNGDYGVIGTNPSQSHGTFTAVATLHIPIWLGGRTEGDIEQAVSALDQRRAELEDLKGQVEADVRKAYLDLQAATGQLDLTRKNLEIAKETLDFTRQRFEAGVTDNVEVVRAQESVASADLDLVNGLFAHNVAKLSLARAIGRTENELTEFLKLP